MGELHVVAAGFRDQAEAQAAERDLRDCLDVGPGDIVVGPAGGDTSRRGLRAVLAGRFREHRKGVVAQVLQRHHGEIVADIPVRALGPRQRART